MLEQLTSSTERPYAVVLGGSKVSDKLGVIESLATKADSIVIGGGMCFTFLAAQGYSVGKSLLEEHMVETCRNLLDTYADVLRLPGDIVVTENFTADSPPQFVAANAIPDGLMGLDIGPGSVKRFGTLLSNAKTVFWNGPMGVFEFPGLRRRHPRCRRGDRRGDRQRRVQRRRRRRLRRRGPRAENPGGRLLAHLHRRRGIAGIP